MTELCLKYITYDPNYNYDNEEEEEDEEVMEMERGEDEEPGAVGSGRKLMYREAGSHLPIVQSCLVFPALPNQDVG